MIEKNNSQQEKGQEQVVDTHEAKRRSQELLDQAKHEAQEAKHHHKENIDELRNEIEKQAATAKEMGASEAIGQQEPEAANTYWYSSEYRKQAYDQMLRTVRNRLPKRDQLASKLFHQPMVEKASEIGSKTVARPSGVLTGSILSFVSSFVIYFFSKRYGFDMTYSIFIMSFLGGFVLGVAVEFGYKGVKALMARH
jgi:hypothetical protein